MTASHAADPSPGGDSLAQGASPARIRAALLAEDRAEFDRAYAAALDEARASLALTGLFEMVESWRRRAALQADPDNFRRVARRAAEVHTGETPPENESLSVTRAKAGL